MSELIAVRGDLRLFVEGEMSVILDVMTVDVYDPAPLVASISQDGWTEANAQDKAAVLDSHLELVDAQFKLHQPKSNAKTYRVPKAVQNFAQRSLGFVQANNYGDRFDTTITDEIINGSLSQASLTTIADYFSNAPSKDDPAFGSYLIQQSLYGGENAVEWARKVQPLTAAGEEPVAVEVDPEEPHEFDPSEEKTSDEQYCLLCGKSKDDEIHVDEAETADLDPAETEDKAGSTVEFFASLSVEPNDKGEYLVETTYAKRGDNWFSLVEGEWVSVDVPVSAYKINAPEVTSVFLSEEALTELGVAELDLESLDAVFAGTPYIDPQVRAQNAQKQVRDGNGRFIQVGARLKTDEGVEGEVVSVNADGTVNIKTIDGVATVPGSSATKSEDEPVGEPQARLKEAPELLEDVAARIAEYEASIGGSETPDAPEDDEPIIAAVESSAVKPLYLAIVDRQDTQAVLDLVAIIPAEAGRGVEAYKRVGNEWVSAGDILEDLQGATPPPVVELSESDFEDVVSQISQNAMTASAGYIEHALTATLTNFAISQTGELTSSQTSGAVVLFPSYSLSGLPRDVNDRLDAIAAAATVDGATGAARLKRYWTTGEGGVKKIRWNTPGDWTRCHRELRKYLGNERSKGYCSNLHKAATGVWPGDKGRPGPGV